MKKFLALMFSVVMILSLAACGSSKDTPAPTPTSKPSSTPEPTKADSKPTEAPTDNTKPTEAPTDNSESNEGSTNDSEPTEAPTDNTEPNEGSTDDSSVSGDLTSFLADFELVKPDGNYRSSPWEFPDFNDTGWKVTSVMIDGKANADVTAFLEEKYGGRLDILFESISEGKIVKIQGKYSTPDEWIYGSFSILSDGYMMSLTFNDGEKYTAVFVDVNEESTVDINGTSITNVNRTPIMILFPDTTGKNVIYLTYISAA